MAVYIRNNLSGGGCDEGGPGGGVEFVMFPIVEFGCTTLALM